ncbi:MAG: hypothetical protein II981_05010 [Bacteroidales bacterium]|nr:hypothetical protein [Bacteroidales bacterium]
MKKRILLAFAIAILSYLQINAQCVQCSDGLNMELGENASRLGTSTISTGHSSLASGYSSTASGNYSTALGYDADATGMYSVAIGKNVQAPNTSFVFGRDMVASGSNSIAIGSGYSSSAVLTNNVAKSIMLGAGSSSPSITIRQTSAQDLPAFVGVGTTSPQQQMHINGNTLISGSGKALLFSTSASTTDGNFGIKYTGSGLNFYIPNNTNYLMYIRNNGYVGIGTSSPTEKLEVSGNAKATNVTATSAVQSSTLTVTGNVTFNSLAGSSSKILTVGSNGLLSSADMSEVGDGMGNHIATTNLNLNGKNIVGATNGTGGIYVAQNGNVRIGAGTANPTKTLEVNGAIRSKEVLVEVANWSDFVFDKDYDLMTLKEVESYIKENGHLPDVPSAEEVKANGVEVGEMNAILLQKIEELTLYIIELEKKIEKLNDGKE